MSVLEPCAVNQHATPQPGYTMGIGGGDADRGASERKESLRFVLVGRPGHGKSATGNTILGGNLFKESAKMFSPNPDSCELHSSNQRGIQIEIVECPGLFDPAATEKQKETCINIVQQVVASQPGPHAILYVIRSDDRYTALDFKGYERLKAVFDENICKYMIIVLTRGTDSKGFGRLTSCCLKKVVNECNGRYIFFENSRHYRENPHQVERLLDMVRKMVDEQGGQPYKCPKYIQIDKGIYKKVEGPLNMVEWLFDMVYGKMVYEEGEQPYKCLKYIQIGKGIDNKVEHPRIMVLQEEVRNLQAQRSVLQQQSETVMPHSSPEGEGLHVVGSKQDVLKSDSDVVKEEAAKKQRELASSPQRLRDVDELRNNFEKRMQMMERKIMSVIKINSDETNNTASYLKVLKEEFRNQRAQLNALQQQLDTFIPHSSSDELHAIGSKQDLINSNFNVVKQAAAETQRVQDSSSQSRRDVHDHLNDLEKRIKEMEQKQSPQALLCKEPTAATGLQSCAEGASGSGASKSISTSFQHGLQEFQADNGHMSCLDHTAGSIEAQQQITVQNNFFHVQMSSLTAQYQHLALASKEQDNEKETTYKFLCSHCNTKEKVNLPPLYITCRGTFTDYENCQYVDLYVLIWDERLHDEEFMMKKSRINIMTYQDPVLIRTSSKTKEKLQLSITESRYHPELRHRLDGKGEHLHAEQMIYNLIEKFGCEECNKKSTYGLMQHQWSLELPSHCLKLREIEIYFKVSALPFRTEEDVTSVGIRVKKQLPRTSLCEETSDVAVQQSCAEGISGNGASGSLIQYRPSANIPALQLYPGDQRLIGESSSSADRNWTVQNTFLQLIQPYLTAANPDFMQRYDDEETTFKYVHKEIILTVANNLESDGSLTFFLDLGLLKKQFDEISRQGKRDDLTKEDVNYRLLYAWCQSAKEARKEDAVEKLIKSLEKIERIDIVEKVRDLQKAEANESI